MKVAVASDPSESSIRWNTLRWLISLPALNPQRRHTMTFFHSVSLRESFSSRNGSSWKSGSSSGATRLDPRCLARYSLAYSRWTSSFACSGSDAGRGFGSIVTSRDSPLSTKNPEGGKREATHLIAASDQVGGYPASEVESSLTQEMPSSSEDVNSRAER